MPVGVLVLPDPADVRANKSYGNPAAWTVGTLVVGGGSGGGGGGGGPLVSTTGPSGPMTFGQPTTLPALLDVIAAQIAVCLSLDPAFVFPSLDLDLGGDMEAMGGPADTFVVLTSPRGRVDQAAVAGGGNFNLAVDGSFTLELWNRCDVDENYRDTQALKDAAIGILARWRLLLRHKTGLQMFRPLGTGSQSIVREPIRLLDWDLRPRLAKAGWVKHVSRWEVKYIEDTST